VARRAARSACPEFHWRGVILIARRRRDGRSNFAHDTLKRFIIGGVL
jgi:hypothetical protein